MAGTDAGSLAAADGVWRRLTQTQPEPETWLVLLTAGVALFLVGPRPVWRLTRTSITLAHEGGHALVALLTGRTLEGIRLHSDTSGLTVSRGRPTGFGMILTSAAGYVAPSLLGLGGAALLVSGHVTGLLWGATVLLLAMLVMIRNLYGILTVVLTGAVFVLVSWQQDVEVQAAFAHVVVWFLLLGGVRPVAELQRKRYRGIARDSDADQLARLTGVPGIVWVVLFLAVTLVCLLLAGQWLLPAL